MEKMLISLKEQRADCVYCGRSYYDDVFSKRKYKNSVQYPLDVIESILKIGKTGFLAMPDILFKFEVFKDNPDIRFHNKTWQYGCEDIDLFSLVYKKGYIFKILKDEYLVKVRWHNSDEPNHSVLRGNNRFERLGDLYEY